ncbi:putative nuclease HARBI1, partial [Stegodyphus mimosarum]
MAAGMIAYELLRRQAFQKRTFRKRYDAFKLRDDEFVKLFRLPKHLVRFLCEQLQEELKPLSETRTALSVEIKVLCALRFFATGSHQKDVAADLTLACSQASVSRAIMTVSAAINKVLFDRYVYFPPFEQYGLLKKKFLELTKSSEFPNGFPNILGAIDSTYVGILAPSGSSTSTDQAYLNRKGNHSLNVQLVCDANMQILNVNADCPGNSRDSVVWHSDSLRELLMEHTDVDNTSIGWLIGDKEFPLEPWLLTPVLNPETNAEYNYNACHARIRQVSERCIALLKSRFKCLSENRVLHYNPFTAASIIKACTVLHNMCIKNNMETREETVCDENEGMICCEEQESPLPDMSSEAAYNLRRNLIQT